MIGQDSSQIDANAPWPGLHSYSEASSRWFCGRENEVAELFRLVRRETLTILFGRSGLGKTSLLQAGLFPALRDADFFPIRIRLDFSGQSVDALTQIIDEIAVQSRLHNVQPPSHLSVPQDEGANTLWECFNRREADFWSADDRILTPVLVLDQFEEVFTLGHKDATQRAHSEALLQQIGDLVENRRPESLRARIELNPALAGDYVPRRERVRIVLSFREDYLPDFDVLYDYIRARTSNRLRLQPMTMAAAEAAVLSAGDGRLVTADVAPAIIRFVSGADVSGQIGTPTVEPALLSLVCRELNEQRIVSGEETISANLIRDDSARQIIEQFYRQGFVGLDKRVRQFVEDRLLTAAGHRDSCAMDNALSVPGVSDVALQSLVERRILRREEIGGQVRLELIHDLLAGVANTSRTQRRETEAIASYNKMLAGQRKQKRWIIFGAFALIVAQGFLFWLAWDVFQLKAVAKHNFAALLAEKAERAFDEQRFNEARVLSAHALAGLDSTRDIALPASLFGRRIANPSDRPTIVNGHGANIAILSPDGKFLAALGSDKSLAIWSMDTENVVALQGKGTDRIESLAFSPDSRTLAGASDSNTMRIWNVENGKTLVTISGHEKPIMSVAFSPDGKIVVSGSADNTVRLWNATNGNLLATLSGHDKTVRSVTFSANGRNVASGADDNTIRLWDVFTGKALSTLHGHNNAVESVALSPDGKLIATGARDKSIRLWDIASSRPVASLTGHTNSVSRIVFSPNGQLLASGSKDKTVRLWDVTSRKELRILGGHPGNVRMVAFSTDGKNVVSSGGHTITRWTLASDMDLGTLRGHEDRINVVRYSPDGLTLATGADDNTIRLWDASNGKLLATLAGHDRPVKSIAYSSDGRRLVSGSMDSTVRLWDITSGRLLSIVGTHDAPVESVAMAPDGLKVASGSQDKTIRLWNIADGKPLASLIGHEKSVNSVAFSPDGHLLASGSEDKSVRLWDVTSGKEVRVLKGGVYSVVFSPDGKLLASGYFGGFKLWEVASGELVHAFDIGFRKYEYQCIVFSPDGKTLGAISGSTLRLWDTSSGKALGDAIEARLAADFSPDGKWIVAGYRANTVRIWPVNALATKTTDLAAAAVAEEVQLGLRLDGVQLVPIEPPTKE